METNEIMETVTEVTEPISEAVTKSNKNAFGKSMIMLAAGALAYKFIVMPIGKLVKERVINKKLNEVSMDKARNEVKKAW